MFAGKLRPIIAERNHVPLDDHARRAVAINSRRTGVAAICGIGEAADVPDDIVPAHAVAGLILGSYLPE